MHLAVLSLLPLALLLLAPPTALQSVLALRLDTNGAGGSAACRLASPSTAGAVVSCSTNATRVDLSGMGLSGRLTLTFGTGHPSDNQLRVDLLDLSGNPGLVSASIADDGFRAVQVGRLDISGTAMAPVPGRLLSFPSGLLSVHTLTANGTTYPGPLDMGGAADLLYRMRVQAFALVGWTLANGSLPANLTSHRANSCASKRFESISVTRSRSLRSLNGGASAHPVLTVSDAIDLSGNGLRSVSNVVFKAGRIDLSDNQLANLPGVTFQPGSVCGVAVTGPPTLLLRRNRLVYAALDSLAGSSQGFSGIDLSGNQRLLVESAAAAVGQATPKPSRGVSSSSRIRVSDFLGLSDLAGHVADLAALLARFRPAAGQSGSDRTFRLSLADNWIPDLASAAALVAEFVALDGNSSTSSSGGRPPAVHLDLSGNPLLVHLNLSDMPPGLLASLTARRLPHLRSASVRVVDDAGAGVLERLRRLGERPDSSVLADLWSRRVPLRLDARPDRCCLADDSEVVCSFRRGGSSEGGGRQRAGSVFCYDEADGLSRHYLPPATTQPPELPLLFSCVVLGCALLLGLATGVAVFYARHSRGRYAVYSIYAVHTKDQQHHQQQQHHHVHHHPSGRVQLKAVSSVLPIEKAGTPV